MPVAKKNAIFLLCFSLFLVPCTLFAGGRSERQPVIETRLVTYLQDRYNALEAPGIIMLPVSGMSAVSPEVLVQVEMELHRQLVNGGTKRPVRMDRWLSATYANNRAANPFVIMNAIMAEQFVLPLRYMGKPFVFRDGERHYFILYVYLLETHYPIAIFRQFNLSQDSLEEVIASCLAELHVRLPQSTLGAGGRRRVLIDNFSLDFFQLVQVPGGEFYFAATPFIEKDGIILRTEDDFFSRTLGYILETTTLFRVIHAGDMREFSNALIPTTTTLVDYRIRGRVLLSPHESILHVDVINVRSGATVLSLLYPLLSFSFEKVWDAYRFLSVQIVESLFAEGTYGVVPALHSPGRGFFANNMFVGWNTVENLILPRGLHVISTGNNLQVEFDGNSVNSYHVMLENKSVVYADDVGRHIWNLLQR